MNKDIIKIKFTNLTNDRNLVDHQQKLLHRCSILQKGNKLPLLDSDKNQTLSSCSLVPFHMPIK